MWGYSQALTEEEIKKLLNKKIKYDTVSFSDGFTVSIPWESTAKEDLADLRMENVDPAEDEYVPASMILYLGIEKFLGLLELRDLSLTSTMEVNGISESGLKIMQTDDEFNAELAQPPTDEDFKNGLDSLWDSIKLPEDRKAFFEDEKPQTPDWWNKEFSELMLADQQALTDSFRNGIEHNSEWYENLTEEQKQELLSDYNWRKERKKSARAIEKIIPIQKTGEELKKEREKFQEENNEEYEIIVSNANWNTHTCKIALDRSKLEETNAANRMHKEWDKKHPDNTWNNDLHWAVGDFRTRWKWEKNNPGKSYETQFEEYGGHPNNHPYRREATELEKEYDQFLKEFESANPFALDHTFSINVSSLTKAGDFEGALSYIKENIDLELHQYPTQQEPFTWLAYIYQKLARYDDALLAIELQLLIGASDSGYFSLVDVLMDMDWKFDAITALKSMEKRISCWKNPFEMSPFPEQYVMHLLESFQKAYNRIGDAPKEQEYIEKIIEFQKTGDWNIDSAPTLEEQIKIREDLAKCLLKQGKFKPASVILDEANKLRDEFATQKPAEKKKQVQVLETQELKPVGKGFEDPFPNMSEDDYVATLEFEFRNMIVDKLMRFTNWQKERVPRDVWEKAAELKKTAEADPILLDYEKRIIDYVDFTDYIRIFRYKKNWEKIFQPVFKDSDLFFGQLKILQKLRNPIAHHRGNKLRSHLSKHGHGQLVQIYNYFMFMIQQDKDRNQPLEVH